VHIHPEVVVYAITGVIFFIGSKVFVKPYSQEAGIGNHRIIETRNKGDDTGCLFVREIMPVIPECLAELLIKLAGTGIKLLYFPIG
jgi:hypothetical protein